MGIAASLVEVPLRFPGRVMLVTAHPDDESMFFVPVVQSLIARNLHVMLLCLTSGVLPSESN
jgi:LmbE family N-acetylglucosaminyl deacetylase